MKHFGVSLVQRKYSLVLTRDEFALISTKPSLPRFDMLVKENAYSDDSTTAYSISWCEKYRKLCLDNFDLNMRYFDSLDSEEFNRAINNFLKKHRMFVEVTNLQNYVSQSGYYFLVLDQYK